MALNTTGSNNAAVGENALSANTSGSENAVFGVWALDHNTTGNDNVAIGKKALSSSVSGHYNSAVGMEALFSNNSGSYNTAVGIQALYNNTEGNYNTAVGYNSGPASGGLTNTSALGSNAFVTASNCINIGGSAVSWIGGQVGWSAISDERFKRNIQENVHGLDFILKLKPVTYQWDIGKLDSYRGIPDSLVNNQTMQEARVKQEAIVYTGFLAQQVEKAAADAGYDFSGVNKPANDKTPYSLTYESFTVPIVKSIQEQQALLNDANAKINILEVKNNALEEKNRELENRLKLIEERLK